MRLHRNLVFPMLDGLNSIFNEGAHADKTVETVLKRDKRWGSKDRGFIAETTYDIVRWKRLYAQIAEVKEPYSKEDLFRIFAVWIVLRGIGLPEWKELSATPVRRIKGRFDELSKIRVYRESIPDWLDDIAGKALGEDLWNAEIAALNTQAAVVLRTNQLKSTTRKLSALLKEEGFDNETLAAYPAGIKLRKRANIFNTQMFKAGLFEVQDASSQLVAPFLKPKPGEYVIDACAGAGGKTLHLAALMENKGHLLAMDIYPAKLKELKRRARRNGVHNTETRLIDSQKVIKKLHGRADRVLIDAPCSGLGVLRRNPDTKWKLQPDFLEKVISKQDQLLQAYSKMVKAGGVLVYATCSILPQENSSRIDTFLSSESGKDFVLEEEQKIFASQSGFDGFYMARLKRK